MLTGPIASVKKKRMVPLFSPELPESQEKPTAGGKPLTSVVLALGVGGGRLLFHWAPFKFLLRSPFTVSVFCPR